MLNKVKRVVFFGYFKSFDYYKIGGLESFYRRLSQTFLKDGLDVQFVFYGSEEDYNIEIEDGLGLFYFSSFKKSLDFLEKESTLVFDNYLLKKHRLRYLSFRYRNDKKVLFGRIFSGIPSNTYLKVLSYEYKFFPYNGPIISLSNTIEDKLNNYNIKSKIVLPSIPDNYYVYNQKKENKKIKITFVGRFDENKGIYKVLDLFKKLSISKQFSFVMSGYFAHGKIDTEKIKEEFTKIDDLVIDEKSWKKWSYEMDNSVIDLLRDTDILILPYKNLDGTMDPPLLVLEGMAAGCIIFTTDVGSVKEIYNFNDYYADYQNFDEVCFNKITEIVKNGNHKLIREKINQRLSELKLNKLTIEDYINKKDKND